ncbi:T9SS type A sorting domain-containing protein [Dyadobacter sp. LHD-138]|uniref:T9SS type A sorting domain-containing protein n=1 Tax=Dyadobacter sp. LHD-138 TaxID=3071413 RepID=UPI0027E0F672|nr:T9SS type A sorting domain-containing protein [Dyadobacter sp. LHD-138]MDQ6482126.1 T9SS type A sorting domain-containing protein [Dyadobacter sp. LHD-138]
MTLSFANAQPCPVLDGGTRAFIFTSDSDDIFFPATLPAGKTGSDHATAGRLRTDDPMTAAYPLKTVTINPEFTDGTVGRVVLRFDLLTMAALGAVIKIYPGTSATGTPAEVINNANAASYLLQTRTYTGPVTVTFVSPTPAASGDFNIQITYTTGDQVVTSPFGFQVAYWTNFITPNSYIALENYPDWAVPIATAYFNGSKQLVSSEISFCTDYGEDAPSIGNSDFPGQFVFHPTVRTDYDENGTVEPIDQLIAARIVYILSHAPQPISNFDNFIEVQSAIDNTNSNPNGNFGGLFGDAKAAIPSLNSPVEPVFSITGPSSGVAPGVAQNFVVNLTNDGGYSRVYTLEIPAGITVNSVTGSGVTYNAGNKTITFASAPASATVSVTSAVNAVASIRVVYNQPGFWNVNNLLVYEPCDSYPKATYQGFLGISKGNNPYPFREASATWLAVSGPAPFPCAGDIYYQIVDGSSLYKYQTDGSRVLASSFAGTNINGIAFNVKDNLIWGYDNATDELIKIGSDGLTQRYTIPGLTSTLSTVNVGTADLNGHLYLYLSGASSYVTIDIDPASSTYLSILDPTNSFAAKTTAPWGTTTAGRSVSDWAYNPLDGKIYGLIDNTGGSPRNLMVLDPLTGTSSLSGVVSGAGIETSTAFGSTFIDAAGNFMVFDNGTGRLFKVAISSRTATLVATSSNTGNNDGAFCGSASYTPLPVTLISLEARPENKVVALWWSTSSETNSRGFEIQRSANGKEWKHLGSVPSGGNSGSTRSYKFNDDSPLNGRNYYRLKMVDLDETFAFSRILSVNIGAAVERMIAYPNPVSGGKLTIALAGTESYSAEVHNLSGVRVLQQNLGKERELNVSGLASGLYVLSVKSANGEVQTSTFLVK